MYLDERSNVLLQHLIKHPTISAKRLAQTYHLSRKQVDYSLVKVNDWLKEQGQPLIYRLNGQFRLHESLYAFLGVSKNKQTIYYIPSENERMYLAILFILTRREELSLNHLIDELQVSKNTVVKDLKQTQPMLAENNLAIHYSRIKGYFIEGTEWDKREMMIAMVAASLKENLAEQGIQITATESRPTEAIQLAKNGTFDFIIFTSPLPEGDYGIPVINATGLLTGFGEDEFFDEVKQVITKLNQN